MSSRLRVLVTGGTGFLGRKVRPLLKDIADVTILSRSLKEDFPKTLYGDLVQWDAGVDIKKIKGRYDVLLHMAGLYNLRINEIEGLRQNVQATHTAMTLAQKADIPHFIHISTVAVVVKRDTLVCGPDDLETTDKFPDEYARSKTLAEQMVRYWPDGFQSKLILRPGILVGDTTHGHIHRIDGPYFAAQSFEKILPLLRSWSGPLLLPGKAHSSLPLVPVDIAAKAIVDLLRISREQNWQGTKSLYLTPREGLKARDLYQSILNQLDLKHKIHLLEKTPDRLLKETAEFFLDLPKQELEYLLNLPTLDSRQTEEILGQNWCPEFSEYENVFWKGYREYLSHR